jgi:hypothetical protein
MAAERGVGAAYRTCAGDLAVWDVAAAGIFVFSVLTALFVARILQNARDAFISGTSSLEPGRICMISSYSQIAPSRPKPMLDAYSGL